MKIFYDTEFIEDGRTIDLISIGMVAEDGCEYYAVTSDRATIGKAADHPWLSLHVVPSLPVMHRGDHWRWDVLHPDFGAVRERGTIAREVRDFILAEPDPQLWAWYGAYDHVALCQLWGTMMHLPKGVPMWTNDLKQEAERLGNPQVPEQESGEHNALADARHNRAIAEFLAGLAGAR